MMRNLGLRQQYSRPRPPFRIVFSMASTTTRRLDFRDEIEVLRNNLDPEMVLIEEHYFYNYTLPKQAELTSQTSIYISSCGGGAVTSMFLPQGASAFLYYPTDSGHQTHDFKLTGTPARLDWDLFNNLGYVRVHWLPQNSKKRDLDMFLDLVRHEVGILQSEFSGEGT